MNASPTRYCTRCNQLRPESAFYRTIYDRIYNTCLTCRTVKYFLTFWPLLIALFSLRIIDLVRPAKGYYGQTVQTPQYSSHVGDGPVPQALRTKSVKYSKHNDPLTVRPRARPSLYQNRSASYRNILLPVRIRSGGWSKSVIIARPITLRARKHPIRSSKLAVKRGMRSSIRYGCRYRT